MKSMAMLIGAAGLVVALAAIGCGPDGATDGLTTETSGALQLTVQKRASNVVEDLAGTQAGVQALPSKFEPATHWFLDAEMFPSSGLDACAQKCAIESGYAFLECMENGEPFQVCHDDDCFHACRSNTTPDEVCEKYAWEQYDRCFHQQCL